VVDFSSNFFDKHYYTSQNNNCKRPFQLIIHKLSLFRLNHRRGIMKYCRRLIESIGFPLEVVNSNSLHDKNISSGHISSLHQWWARRPLPSCRAVILSSLWPDPEDKLCPEKLRNAIKSHLSDYADWDESLELKDNMFNFIKLFSSVASGKEKAMIDIAQKITMTCHEHLRGEGVDSKIPLVIDSFSGGGSIPFEALRCGASVYAGDLNPIAYMINNILLDSIQQFKLKLPKEVKEYGDKILVDYEKEMTNFYPSKKNEQVIGYRWARTLLCNDCKLQIPLIKDFKLANKKKSGREIFLNWKRNKKGKITCKKEGRTRIPQFEIIENTAEKTPEQPTIIKGGHVQCPDCDTKCDVSKVRKYLCKRNGGTDEARMIVVISKIKKKRGRLYSLPSEIDLKSCIAAEKQLEETHPNKEGMEPRPTEAISSNALGFRIQGYGMTTWGQIFSKRQALSLFRLAQLINEVDYLGNNIELGKAVRTALSFSLAKVANFNSSLARWAAHVEKSAATYSSHSLRMIYDWIEIVPHGDSFGSFNTAMDYVIRVLKSNIIPNASDDVEIVLGSATSIGIKEKGDLFIIDPPYYDDIGYGDLSDFFYVWHRRSLAGHDIIKDDNEQSPKEEECVVNPGNSAMGKKRFERIMSESLREGKNNLNPAGIGILIYAHKTDQAWDAQLSALHDAGWIVTNSIPITTERKSRMRAQNSEALATSQHIVCRPKNHFHALSTNDCELVELRKKLEPTIKEVIESCKKMGLNRHDTFFATLGRANVIRSKFTDIMNQGKPVSYSEFIKFVREIYDDITVQQNSEEET
jgi:adenine-specific DNA methylase